jgi:phospholipid/cholesterol/gamma-HCH transport system substrate-binding protein
MFTFYGEPADPYHGQNAGKAPGDKCCGPYVPPRPENPIPTDPATGLPIPTNPAAGLPGMMVPPGGDR